MNRGSALLAAFAFLVAMVVGAQFARVVSPPPPANPWRELPRVEEAAAGRAVTVLMLADDAVGLARALELPLLERLAQAIDPLVDIDEAHFTGATERDGDILSAYVVGGRDRFGERAIVGVVFRVRDGKVIGVN